MFSDSSDQFMRAVKSKYGNHGLTCAALGLAGEAGEVVELVKKKIFHSREIPLEKFEEELGDVFFYLYACCRELLLDPTIVMAKNINKLEKRYPDGFVPGGGIR